MAGSEFGRGWGGNQKGEGANRVFYRELYEYGKSLTHRWGGGRLSRVTHPRPFIGDCFPRCDFNNTTKFEPISFEKNAEALKKALKNCTVWLGLKNSVRHLGRMGDFCKLRKLKKTHFFFKKISRNGKAIKYFREKYKNTLIKSMWALSEVKVNPVNRATEDMLWCRPHWSVCENCISSLHLASFTQHAVKHDLSMFGD